MAMFKCKMCGGDLEIAEGASVAECQYCGSKQTLPRFDSERKLNLYDRANHFRRNNEFDKAEGIYENILNEDPTDAEAYWSLVLCRYGIEYVEDPATHRRVPTVNRAQYTSVFADENYKKAVEYADTLQKSVYEDEAKAIDAIQKGILEISEKEDPFDVFICYKETDPQGRRTPDSVLANELYHELTNEGFKVFFSRITLEDKLGTAYEPYIFAALHSAKVMVVLGTKPEYFNAVWVKNEWSRYLALIRSGEKKTLIPAYRDMDPYDLPEEFSHLQAQDMSKLGFMPDLIRGIKKLLQRDEPKMAPVVQQVVQPSAGGANLTAQIKRGQQALEDGDWSAADGFFDKALDIDAECAEAFFGKALAVAKCSNGEALVRTRLMNPATEKEMLTACERDSQHIGELVKQYSVPGYFGEDRANELFAYDKRIFQSLTRAWNERIRQEKSYWEQNRQLSRAVRYSKGELAETLKSLRERVDTALHKSLSESEEADTKAKADVLERYHNAMEQAEEKAKQLHDEAVKRRQADYESACEAQKAAVTDEDFDKVASKFEAEGLMDFEDSNVRARKCRMEAVRQREKARERSAAEAEQKRIAFNKAEEARKAKKKKTLTLVAIIVLSFIVVLAAGYYTVTKVVVPAQKYKKAEELLINGDNEGAFELFELLGDYKDSTLRANEIAYSKAQALLAGGDTLGAAMEYGKAGNYMDAYEQACTIWDKIAIRDTITTNGAHTVGIRADGTAIATGDNSVGQCDINDWANITEVSAGDIYTVGLVSDGTVVATEYHSYGYDVSDWTGIVALSAGENYTVGLKANGTVVATGANNSGQCNVDDWTDIIAVSASSNLTVGLRANGTVVVTGYNVSNNNDISSWTDIVAVATGKNHTIGLKANGTVVATGFSNDGQCDVIGWTDIMAVSAGDNYTVGLKTDGTVVAVGKNDYGQCDVSGWTGIVAISAGDDYTIGLKVDGTVVAVGNNDCGQCNVSEWTNIKLPIAKVEDTYQQALKFFNNEDYSAAVDLFSILGDYKDSAELAEKAKAELQAQLIEEKYQGVLSAVNNQNYEEIEEILIELGDYKDSKEILKELRDYNAAIAAMAMDGYYLGMEGFLPSLRVIENGGKYISLPDDMEEFVKFFGAFVGTWTYSSGDERLLSYRGNDASNYRSIPNIDIKYTQANGESGIESTIQVFVDEQAFYLSLPDVDNASGTISETSYVGGNFIFSVVDKNTLQVDYEGKTGVKGHAVVQYQRNPSWEELLQE